MKHPFLALFASINILVVAMGCKKPVTSAEHELYLHSGENGMDINDKTSLEGREVFFVFGTRSYVEAGPEIPSGFYAKGQIVNNKFVPTSGVLGVGDLAKNGGRYGWLELNTKNFFPMESDQEAQVPFVKGYLQREEVFVPSNREIYSSP